MTFNVYKQFPTPVIITSMRGAIEYVNPAFTQMTGYSGRDLIGKNPRVLSAGKTSRRVYKKLWDTILSGEIWQGELQNRRKDGRSYLESIFIAPMKNDRGKITHFIASWQDVTARKRIEQGLRRRRRMLEKVSLQDELTGCYNRRGFFALMEHQIQLSRRHKKQIAILYFDMDHLKQINDKFGHKSGDRALIAAAKLLHKTFRTSDIVARLGGDEFVVAAIDSEREGLEIIVRRLRANFEEYNRLRAKKLGRLEFSLGSILIEPGETADLGSLLEKADRLMYREKERKRSGR